jgi:DNA invertase Pin-like site-specific DNA recombinase
VCRAVFGTLIADEDGLFDPSDYNDRLVPGLKGTLFSAELHIIRARMRGGLLNKARRGAIAQRLPSAIADSPTGAWSRTRMSRSAPFAAEVQAIKK